MKIDSDGIFENPLGKSAPDVSEEGGYGIPSVQKIRGVDVRNTIDPPGETVPKSIPNKLPFD